MVLIILVVLLIAGIAFYQAVQGLFSSLIMAILTILCTVIAFEYYEPLARLLYTRQPAHADAGALIALLVIPLLVLRFLVDRYVPGNAVTGAWPDRIGGGAMGAITGIILVGMLMIALQMLPMGPRFLTYRPYNDALKRHQRLAPFYPDEFTVGLVNVLSGGSFGSDPRKAYVGVHDDLLLELHCARNQIEQTREVDDEPRQERIGRVDALPDSLTILGVFEPNQPAWADEVPRSPILDTTTIGRRILVVRVAVSDSARDRDNWWRLPATHFRLITRKGKDLTGPITSHYPVAYLSGKESTQDYTGKIEVGPATRWRVVPAAVENKETQVGQLSVQRPWAEGPEKLIIDWVYQVGRDDTPVALAFRRVAVQATPAPKPGMPRIEDSLDRLPERPRRRR